MSADVIKDYLVALGFDVDEAGKNKFDTVLKGVTANVLKVSAAVEGAALAIVGFTTQIASGLDKVYWASQRTGASVQGIKALGYAASQMGGDVQAATSSLEGLASFMRSNPGAEGFLNRLGVQTRDASGKMRDTASIFTGVGQKLNNMPYYRAKQYAQMLGIDENTLMAMRRGLGQFSSEYALTAKRIGFNAEAAAKQSNVFMTSMRSLTMTLGQARDKIGSRLAGGLAGSIDNLRKQLLDNWPKIEAIIMKVIKGILWAGDAITRVLWRTGQAVSGVIEWFKKLDPETKKLIELFGGLLIAWRLLNSAFLMSPIGFITLLAGALVLLYDDYKTWKEGGKSLIDWAKWEPAIEKAKKAILWLRDKLIGLKDDVGGWQNTLEILATYVAGSWAIKMLSGISKVGKGFGPILAAMAAIDAWNKVGEAQEKAKKIGVSTGEYLVNRMRKEAAERESSGNTISDRIMKWWHELDQGNAPAILSPQQQAAQSTIANASFPLMKPPQASAQGKVLLDWMGPMFSKLESLYRLPEGLLKSVAITESGGNQFAMSGAGAKGLFQFMDGTAKDMGLRGNDVFDPAKSAQAAAKYLSQLLQKNGGDLNKTLASYNWGIGNVQRYGMELMPQETRNYIPKVMSNMPATAPSIQQETTINIHGVADPREAARLTVDRQKGVNSQLTQQIPMVPR